MASAFPQGVDPATVPAALPPPGVNPNLVNPQTLEAVTIAISVPMIVLTLSAVGARFFATVRINRSTGMEDYSCLLALILLYIYIAFVYDLNKYSRHIWDIPAIWVDASYFKGRFARDMFIGPATFFAKASILLLYLRLFAPKTWFRYTIWCTMGFMFALYFSYIAVNASLCAPRPGQSWLFPGVLQKCLRQETYLIIQGGCNVAIDVLILVLPVPVIMKLRMKKSRKIGILAVFGTGLTALVCSVISLVYRIKLNGSADSFWIGAVVFIAIILEISITIICSCAPAIFSLGRHILSNSSLFASFRSGVMHTKEASNRTHNANEGKDSYTLGARPPHIRENGYLELGEVGDIERKLTGAAFGREGGAPTTTDTDYVGSVEMSHIRKTTDVDVIYSDEINNESHMSNGFPSISLAATGQKN